MRARTASSDISRLFSLIPVVSREVGERYFCAIASFSSAMYLEKCWADYQTLIIGNAFGQETYSEVLMDEN